MGKRVFSIAATVMLVLCVMGAALAEDIVPQVTLSFDLATWTYTYHVVVPAYATHPFGELSIYSQAVGFDDFTDFWTASGPFVGSEDQGWGYELTQGDLGTTVRWRSFGNQQVQNGPASWEGDFIIVAPNTYPVAGSGMTKNGVVTSINNFSIDVPGAVPEPSSLVAFGSLVTAAAAFMRRRR